ncbi:hypothetical protein KBB96_10975 [Luteolibacter ambystomatis]|uniref:SLA1 homology domain-containing protein n=1 Tax=Luteolibacter ambystomatis TaxID=2824561 RepID=A0A975IXS9_9BACT|nr:hypothetical protein [Luteolibacter ambystomatis]QUE49394.1 hypothetical protein KBB96_10975 [Luteolibacter ambystomatis]
MKARALLALCLCSTALQAATESRLWTSTDGRTLEGVFLRSDRKTVTVRKPEGRTTEIPLDRLSAEDRSYVEKQVAEQADSFASGGKTAKKPQGRITYKLSGGSEKWEPERKKRIVEAMDKAVAFYNEHSDFKKALTANNSPGTPTADGNISGWINFGGQIGFRVTLHEMGHTLGIGTHGNWQKNIKDGLWTGKHALAQLKEFDGPDAVLHADRMHFWPYGMNYDNEASDVNYLRHVKMVVAMCKDME